MSGDTGEIFLSVFAPLQDEWVWSKLNPLNGAAVELATFKEKHRPWPGDAVVSPDGAEAMVVARGAHYTLHRLSTRDGKALHLPACSHEFVLLGGYDEQGTPVALYGDRNRLERIEGDGGPFWLYEGERYPFQPDVEAGGQLRNVLASVYRLDGDGWRLVERKAIVQHDRADTSNLGVKPVRWGSHGNLRHGARTFIDRSFADRSHPWVLEWGAADEYLEWYRNDEGSRPICFRGYRSSVGLAPPFVVETDDGWKALSEWADYDLDLNDLLGQVRGDFLWLYTGRNPPGRLHNLCTGRVVWEAPAATAGWLWPELKLPGR